MKRYWPASDLSLHSAALYKCRIDCVHETKIQHTVCHQLEPNRYVGCKFTRLTPSWKFHNVICLQILFRYKGGRCGQGVTPMVRSPCRSDEATLLAETGCDWPDEPNYISTDVPVTPTSKIAFSPSLVCHVDCGWLSIMPRNGETLSLRWINWI